MELDSYLLLEMSQKRSKLEVKILQERNRGDHDVLYFPAHHRFYHTFNEKFKQMSEAGLIGHFIQEAKEMYIRNTPQEHVEPFKELTLEELEAGFVVSVVPLLVATVVFCSEWIVASKNLIVLFCILRAFFALKETEINKTKSRQ